MLKAVVECEPPWMGMTLGQVTPAQAVLKGLTTDRTSSSWGHQSLKGDLGGSSLCPLQPVYSSSFSFVCKLPVDRKYVLHCSLCPLWSLAWG